MIRELAGLLTVLVLVAAVGDALLRRPERFHAQGGVTCPPAMLVLGGLLR